MKFVPATRPKRRRRLAVEVYFVLYLSAIILLLGTEPFSDSASTEELEAAVIQLLDTDFSLEVEKIALVIPYVPASLARHASTEIVRRDTVNTLRAHGSFESVDFRIVAIEDTILGRSVPVEDALLVRDDDSTAMFYWRGGSYDRSAIFKVTVAAEASPRIPASIAEPEMRNNLRRLVRERAPMRDSATFVITIIPLNDAQALEMAADLPMLRNDETPGNVDAAGLARLMEFFDRASNDGGRAGFLLAPVTPSVSAPIGGTASIDLSITGLNRSEAADLRFELPPGYRMSSGSDPRRIRLIGPTPSSARTYQVNAVTSDGQRAVASFDVTPHQYDAPRGLPNQAFVGQRIEADFSSSGVESERISVDVVRGDNIVESAGAVVTYTPSSTGSITFIRRFNGVEIDRHRVAVDEQAAPLVQSSRFDPESGGMRITTHSYGMWKDRWNRAQLKILSGNAADPELLDTRIDRDRGIVEMVWLVKPQSGPSGEFVAYPLDQRGSAFAGQNTRFVW